MRHGSRGLSALKHDGALYRMWQKAKNEGELTPLGKTFGVDLLAVMRANAFLGRDVEGISQSGYGNLTQTGMDEQRQLARRVRARLPDFWARVVASKPSTKPRFIHVVSSGVDRAVDSSQLFVKSLTNDDNALAALVRPTPPLTAYPTYQPVAQSAGVNRYLLYFHKLKAKTDFVASSKDVNYTTYQASLAYQASDGSELIQSKIKSIKKSDRLQPASRNVLLGLFKASFIDQLGDKGYRFSNDGEFIFVDNQGQTLVLKGADDTLIAKPLDAAMALYNVYAITPAMREELGEPLLARFLTYMPDEPAQAFAFLNDAKDFYKNGPSIEGKHHTTFEMSQGLLNDFFKQTDDVLSGQSNQAAMLRFGHAEIVMPFVALLGIQGQSEPLSSNQMYSPSNSAWRGELATPLAANVQWDVYRNIAGKTIVKMFFNEKETDFKVTCSSARAWSSSHFYEYQALKKCYGIR